MMSSLIGKTSVSLVPLFHSRQLSMHYKCRSFAFLKSLPHKLNTNAFLQCRLFSLSRSRLCTKSGSEAISIKNGTSLSRKSFSKEQRSEYRRLLRVAHPERWRIAGAVLFLCISSGVSLAVPYCMGMVIDIINTSSKDGTLMTKLNYICSRLLIVIVIGGLANFARVYLLQISGQRIITTMREKLFSSVMRQEVGFFDKTKTGEIINRLSSDTVLIGSSVTQNISDGLRALFQAFGAMGMMVYISPKLTMISLCIVPPIAIASRIYGRYLRNITKKVQDSLAAATSVAEEKISNIRTVRSFAKEDSEMDAYNKSVRNVLKLSYKEALARGIFWGSTGLSGNIVIISVFYGGGLMMSNSLLTVGDLSAFLLYAAYIGISISGLTSFYTELMRGLGASSRIWELSDREPLVPYAGGMIPKGPIQGQIEFRGVNFTYPSRDDTPILSNFNLVMPMGSVTAVVGASGSGKSTIGSLLLRFYDPDRGSVCLDDIDIKNIDPTWLRNQIGVVSQEPALFSCSIADNIKYGATDPSAVTMEMVENAAKQANAHVFIKSFQDQYDTLVGERGVMLSGGQRQRIALARAILKNPRILLLDEATSALDAESEYYVKEALERLMVGRTTITIAHRLSTIKSAHQIAVLNNGQIAELGSYEEIMSIEDGIFKRLVERQTITS